MKIPSIQKPGVKLIAPLLALSLSTNALAHNCIYNDNTQEDIIIIHKDNDNQFEQCEYCKCKKHHSRENQRRNSLIKTYFIMLAMILGAGAIAYKKLSDEDTIE